MARAAVKGNNGRCLDVFGCYGPRYYRPPYTGYATPTGVAPDYRDRFTPSTYSGVSLKAKVTYCGKATHAIYYCRPNRFSREVLSKYKSAAPHCN